MYRRSLIFCISALWIAAGHCNTLILQPFNYVPDAGNSYAWIIPPQTQQLQPTFLEASQNAPVPDQLQSTYPEPSLAAATVDRQNQSPPQAAQGGCGHPQFTRRHSHEQLTLPNEYLISPSDPQRPSPPVFLQSDPVNCADATTARTNEDCSQQQRATAQHQSNLASVPAMPDQRSATVNWPSSHNGGVGLLFFVPESASHLPVEQLIRQHLALHRAQLPFDISMNCADAGPGCLGEKPPITATAFNGGHPENVENVNYASLPLVKNVNSSRQRWRTIGELLAQQQQQQHQRQLSMQPL